MWVGEDDGLCIPEQAEYIRDTVSEGIQYYTTIPGATHMYFASANSDDFVNDVIHQLRTGYDPPTRNFL